MSHQVVVLALLVAAVALGCPSVPPAAPPPSQSSEPVVWRMSKSGLGFRLSDADARDDRPPPLAKATPLSEDDAGRVLGRLEPLGPDPDAERAFALRDRSQPPPRAGKTIAAPFPPPPDARPTANAGTPLTVTRKAPAGNIDLAPFLSVSFSLPMVAVTSHDELARTPPPVTLTPAPAGKWRWVGAQTAVFDPEKRFPMATEYTVAIPAGTRAADGQTLAKAETWTFATPPVKLVEMSPRRGVQGLDPVMYLELDQAIDPDALLKVVELRAGRLRLPIRAATEDEIAADATVRRMADKAQPGRFIAFKAADELARGTTYEVRLPPGTPSAEGPRRTTKEQRFTFRTYDPLRVRDISCGWGRCLPSATISVSFNNPIDPKKFDRSLVRVSPEPEGLRVTLSGQSIALRGRTRGKTTYTVTVGGALTDIFGQTLGQESTRELRVEPATPYLFGEEDQLSVLDPEGGPVLPVFSVNRPALDVKLYAVAPEDWPAYRAWREAWDHEKDPRAAPPGRLVATRVLKPEPKPDELVETPIDLSPALKDGLGQVLVVVEPSGARPKSRWERRMVRTWVQVTKLGLQTFTDDESLVAWATRLSDGSPVSGAQVSLLSPASTKTTTSGADGLCRLALLEGGPAVAVAKKGPDIVMLPDSFTNLRRVHRSDELRWFVFDDRGVYKPGEEVHLKGWLRRIGNSVGGDVSAAPGAAGGAVTWKMVDARGVELGKGTVTVDATGGFDFVHGLPGTPNLGHAEVKLAIQGVSGLENTRASHGFSIEELRRPEFEVSARAGEGPFFVGGHTTVTARASYYAGGGLPNAETTWNISRAVGHFVPPNRSDYAFGKANDLWWIDRSRDKSTSDTWKGRTGPSGEHRVRVDFDAVDPPYPMSLSFDAAITDVNRQRWSAHVGLLVHPADVYVGVKQGRAFVKAGEPLAAELLVADIDGKAVAGRPVTVKSARVEWEYQRGEHVEVEVDTDTCEVTSAAEAVRCSLKTKQGGRYRVAAVVTDAQGRKNRTETHVWVIGPDMRDDRALPKGKVEIIPERQSYQGGETAELLLVAPFAPAEGVLAIERQGVVRVERFHLASTTDTVRFQVDRAWTPNITAQVVLLGKTPREDARGEPDAKLPGRPAYASGSVTLKIPPRDRTLDVKVKPRADQLDPGGGTEIDVDVRDAAGAAVSSTVTLVVVDEAVLALSSYKTPDPLSEFYFDRDPRTREAGTVQRVLVARLGDKELSHRPEGRKKNGAGGGFSLMLKSSPMASAEPAPPALEADHDGVPERKADEDSRPIAVRKDLGALALFAPAVTTDASGRATASVKLPDNLTRYRVMAIAVAGERQFGSSEASITARLPLMVRPSAPRFLNYGDRFELPIVLQNQTDAPLQVDLAARASNASLTGGAGRRVTVPANNRVEVRLPAAAARPGRARFQIGAAAGRFADAALVSLPVWTPATTEAFATYGTVDEGAVAQPVKMPSGVEQSFGGVEITTSSTALSALSDAVLYLVRYPYECNEQIASRVLAVAALREVLSAFSAEGLPPKEVLVASMEADLKKLQARQHDVGGWDFWQSDREPWPYLSIHVTHALVRAKEKGFTPSQPKLDAALRYLRTIEHHIPSFYSPASRRAIIAYALYVRHRMKDADPGRARKLIEEAGGVDGLSMEAVGWLWPTLAADPMVAEIRRHVQSRATETAGAAHFTESYSDGAYVLLHSDRRADGILLEALIGDQPKSDLIPKLVTGLLAHRKAGRWQSTQENAFVLLALDRYFDAYEKATPDFVARAWLGDRYAGAHAFKGRTVERHQIDVPMRALAEVGSGDVVVSKTGTGRLYYRVGMTYAPSDLRPPPSEHGFTVTRVYEAVDDPGDVKRDEDGTWHVKAGAKVRVRVSLVAPARRYHVALVDPLPAGLEVMNPALAVTGAIPKDPKDKASPGWWWRSTWYDHQNLRDERVEAYTSLLWDGVYDYTYVARATTPGVFVAPPPKAEEMYSPETFGRGAGDRVVVE